MKSLFTFENYLLTSVVIESIFFMLGILLLVITKCKKLAPLVCRNGIMFMSVGCCAFIIPAILDYFLLMATPFNLVPEKFDKLRYVINNIQLIVLSFQIHIFTYMMMIILRPIKLLVIRFWLQMSMIIIVSSILMLSIFYFPNMSPYVIFTMLISIFITICIMHITYTYKVINAHIQSSLEVYEYSNASRRLRTLYTCIVVCIIIYFGVIFIPFEYRIMPLILMLLFYIIVAVKYYCASMKFPYKYGKYISPLQRGNNILDYVSVNNVIDDYDANTFEKENNIGRDVKHNDN